MSPRTPLIEEKPLEEEEADDEGHEKPSDETEPPEAESKTSERLRQIQELLRSRVVPVTGRISGTQNLNTNNLKLKHGRSVIYIERYINVGP
jgi:hypothetical protein